MGLQKYRADIKGEKQANGATPYYTRWMGGPTLALVRDCPCENDPTLTPRTVYITSEPDSWYSQPAACRVRGKNVRGYITSNDGELVFRRYLPWLTGSAYKYLSDNLRHYEMVIYLLRGDSADAEVIAVYEAKRVRIANTLARFAARIVRKAV